MNSSTTDDIRFMKLALEEAAAAADRGEVPIGAVAVVGDRVIARAGNRVEEIKSVTAHAEIEVLRQAETVLGDWRMEDVTLYVTKEPCAMCAGALVNARVKRLVFGLADPRSGCCGSALDITGYPGMLWQIPVTGGILADEAAILIKDFFKAARRRDK